MPSYTVNDFTISCGIDWTAGTGPLTDSPAYSNVSADVLVGRGVTLRHGRSPESSRADVGTASFTLKNPAGTYTPGKVSTVTLGRPVRWQITAPGGTAQTVWTGAVTDYKVTRDSGYYGTTTITANDMMGTIGGLTLREAMEADIRRTGAAVYYPLTDAGLNAYISEAITGQSLLTAMPSPYSSAREAGGSVTTDSRWDGYNCAKFVPVSGRSTALVTPSVGAFSGVAGASTGLTTEFWIKPNAAMVTGEGNFPLLCTGNGTGYNQTFQIFENGSGGFAYQATSTGPGGAVSTTNVAGGMFTVGAWHHVAIVQSVAAGTCTQSIYINGVLNFSSSAAMTAVANPYANYYTFALGAAGAATTAPPQYSMAHFAITPAALSTATIAARVRLRNGSTVTPGSSNPDTPGERFQRIAALGIGPVTTSRVAAIISQTAPETLQAFTDFRGQKVADAVDGAVSTCAGVAYCSPTGVFTMRCGGYKYAATPAVTFDARTMLGDNGTLATLDSQGLVNEAQVTQQNGGVWSARNAASVSAYGLYGITATTWSNRFTSAYELASWLSASRATPQVKTNELIVNVVAFVNAGGSFSALAGLTVGSQVQVTNLPTEAPSSTLTLFVDSVEWRLGANEITMTLGTSPALPFTVPTLDAASAVLDSGITLGL